jgi:hypothetical protein
MTRHAKQQSHGHARGFIIGQTPADCAAFLLCNRRLTALRQAPGIQPSNYCVFQ